MGIQQAKRQALNLVNKHSITCCPVDVEAIVKNEGITVGYQVLEETTSGFLLREENEAIIVVNSVHHKNRQRFTMAHELGHFILHGTEPSVFIDGHVLQFRSATEQYVPSEHEANVFAATLLMPDDLLIADVFAKPFDISDDYSVRRLAKKFMVSPQALAIRLTQLDIKSNFF